MDRSNYYKEAQKRVKRKTGFYAHLFSYIIVMGFLTVINLLTSNVLWVMFPAAGWGMGLMFHGLATFNVPGFSKDWEEQMIQREMQRLQEEEEAIRWELKNRQSGKNMDALPPGSLDDLDLEHLKELQKKYRDEDLV